MRRVLLLSQPADDNKPRRRDFSGFPGPREASTCLSASVSLFLGLSLPSHRQLCPLVRMSWRGWPRVICAQGGGDTTRSWTTDNDKEGRSGQMCFSHPLQRACSQGGPSGPLLVIRGQKGRGQGMRRMGRSSPLLKVEGSVTEKQHFTLSYRNLMSPTG